MPIHAKYIENKTFEGIYYMNDVYRRINNTHIREFYFTFILVLLQLCGPLKSDKRVK